MKKLYSWKLDNWVKKKLPKEIVQAMSLAGWNAFGIYELVKEGLVLEKKNNLREK